MGIPASLVYGNSANTNEFSIDSIAPEICDPKNQDELRSAQGLIVTIDTTFIQQNFLLDEEVSEEDEINEDDEMENSGLMHGLAPQ